jgi:hypothetical protein
VPTIAEALAASEQARFVGRADELALFERWLAAEPCAPEVLEISGPGGIGKSSLLAAFQRLATTRGRVVVEVDLRDAAGNAATLLGLLGGTDLPSAAERLNRASAVVLLDTSEEAGDLQRLVAEELLPRLDTRVRVVIAGRVRLSHGWRAERPGRVAIRSIALGGLRPEASRDYLQRRGLADSRLIEQILAGVGGHPLALSLAADLVLHTGIRNFTASPERHLLIRSLAEQLLRTITDPHLRELIEASAIVEQFDQATLEAIIGRPASAAAFEQLCRLSVVRPVTHGLTLHDEVRRILADDLRWRNREQYQSWRQRAAEHFRDRMRSAGAEDREWLLTQRLYLWGHAFVQRMLFGQDDPGEVWVEPGTAEDERDALDIEMIWHTQVLPPLGIVHYELDPEHDTAAHEADIARLLALPGRRLAIARDEHGQALGFSLMIPVCIQTADYMGQHRVLGPLLRAYVSRVGPEAVPRGPEASGVWYMLQLTHKGLRHEAVTPALWRDVFSVFASAKVAMVTAFLKEHKELVRAMGFEPMPGEYPTIWGMSEASEAYVLDLAQIGLEPWIEAIMAGRQPPRALSADELEQAIQDALVHWRDDSWLATSALAQSTVLARLAPQAHGAETVRCVLRQALDRASAGATPDLALAYRAVEGAYLARTTSHERTAEELAVSRTTFYRLLRRGVQGLAQALQNA